MLWKPRARSKPSISSPSLSVGDSAILSLALRFATLLAALRLGLAADSLPVSDGGLLLSGTPIAGVLAGLKSGRGALAGVLCRSAYFQNGAGELLTMYELGTCA